MINGNRTKSTRGRSPRDLYITPYGLALEAIYRLREDEYLANNEQVLTGLDVGCGSGIWGKAADCLIYSITDDDMYPLIDGIDICPTVSREDEIAYYNHIFTQDFLDLHDGGYHLIFGNPPYSLAEEFIEHAFQLLEPDGYIYFLLRLSFLEGINRANGLYKDHHLKRVYVCSRRPSFFSSDGKHHTTDTLAYAMFLWQFGYEGACELGFLDWIYR